MMNTTIYSYFNYLSCRMKTSQAYAKTEWYSDYSLESAYQCKVNVFALMNHVPQLFFHPPSHSFSLENSSKIYCGLKYLVSKCLKKGK